MQIILKNPIELVPYEKNARIHSKKQIELIAKSIKQYGFNNPVLVNAKNQILAGHGRVQAAISLGLNAVPTISLAHLSAKEARAYILADNRLAEMAEWDMAILGNELEELMALEIDVGDIGFDTSFVKSYVKGLVDEDDVPEIDVGDIGFDTSFVKSYVKGLVDEDDVPEIDVGAPKTSIGDVYKLGNHMLICGDSTDPEVVAKVAPEGTVDLIVTDPPYNVAYEGKTSAKMKIQNDKMSGNEFYAFIVSAYERMFTSAKDGCPIYVFHADTEGVNFRLGMVDAGFKLAQCCIWVKQSMVMGRQDYHWQHEPVLYGWKEGAAHTWASDRKQTTIWKFDRPSRNGEHPTMKPIELIQYPIENSSKPGAVVFDPFGGSGSTLIACEKTGRSCRTIEIDPRYADVIVKRWEDYTGMKAVKV